MPEQVLGLGGEDRETMARIGEPEDPVRVPYH